MLANVKLLHRGEKFALRGAGLFVKDVIRDGEWIHPVTNTSVNVTPDTRKSIESNMKPFLAAGNKVPMPDGHVFDAAANKGWWPGPFAAMGEDILAIAQPTDKDVIKQMENGGIDAVSVSWWHSYMDSLGNKYENIFEHVCLTNYPVITKQRKFVALSGKPAEDGSPLIYKTLLEAVAIHQEDEPLMRGLETLYKAIKDPASLSGVKFEDLSPEERISALLLLK